MNANALVAACLLAALAPAAAQADEMAFFMKNKASRAVVVELRSRERDHVWPGDGQVYLLEYGESKTLSIECEVGESICYGAWIQGDQNTFWGVGPGNSQKCENCCYTCTGGQTEQINLVP